MRFYKDDLNEVKNMILAYINGVQAVYHYSSLGRNIDFTIVHLELMSQTPFSEHGGRHKQLLKSFCEYQSSQNSHNEGSDANHWDIALDLTGLDLYSVAKGGILSLH